MLRWCPDINAASHPRWDSKKYLTHSTSNPGKCSWPWLYLFLPNSTFFWSFTNKNVRPKSPPSACRLLNTGNLRWDVGKESEMTCLLYVPLREGMGAGGDHPKGWDVNEGVKRKKEGEKYKEENKSSWWNTNGVPARYHLPRKLHFYLGINECKTCLRPR